MLTQSQSLITAFRSQVKDLVKGQVPDTFSEWYIICSTEYVAKYGDKYQILTTCDPTHQSYIDIICNTDSYYVTLGSQEYNKTLEKCEIESLLADCENSYSHLKFTS